jgi:uncharacterized protein (DUF1800 family)
MNRRNFLQSNIPFFSAGDKEALLPPPNGGLAPYGGAWTETEVIHLLKRTLFGATRQDIDYFKSIGFNQAVYEILHPSAPLPAPPVKEYATPQNAATPDANINNGDSWILDPNTDPTVNNLRIASFKKWWMGVMVNQDKSIREKMTLFWHNHFATQTSVIGNAQFVYKHHNLLRTYALSNFRQLAKAVTIDCGMLVYLNGERNTVQAPDENYGRELQELFCCGKGPGSQYTESDVKAAAKVLTGWQNDPATLTSFFDVKRHDTSSKQFSAFYGNTVIAGQNGPDAGDKEIDQMLDMIFATSEVAKFFCRCLYRWFVYYDIDDTVEANIISPLADILRNNNYDVLPVLDTLLRSEHFFDILAWGCQIKSPVDLVVALCREYGVSFQPDTDYMTNYGFWQYLAGWTANLQQNIGDPPDVSGWKPYYQAPQFHELWISTDTYPKRNQFTDSMVLNGYSFNGQHMQIDGTAFAKTLSNPGDPNQLIDDTLTIIFRMDLLPASKVQIKTDILLGGQTTDYYWTDAWNTYISNPGNTANTTIVQNRLKDLLKYFMDLAEYQLA